MLKKIKVFFQCKVFKMHNWTCATEQGIPATTEQLKGGAAGFWDYSKMYCKDCGHVYEGSQRLIDENKM